MKTFNDERPGDMVTLEMRIKEDVRCVLRAMFISSEDKRKMLEDALESVISTGNIAHMVEQHAHQAINEAVQEYFTYGEGGMALRKAVQSALHEVMPKLSSKESNE